MLICLYPSYPAVLVPGPVPRSGYSLRFVFASLPSLLNLKASHNRSEYFHTRSTAQAHHLRYGALFCTSITMECLFSSCNRLRDLFESQGLHEEFMHDIERWRELNLNASTEELLSAERAFTYADLYAVLGNGETVAWLTPHAAVILHGGRAVDCWGQLNQSCRLYFNVDGKEIYAFARSSR
jgi:hypothetical protein